VFKVSSYWSVSSMLCSFDGFLVSELLVSSQFFDEIVLFFKNEIEFIRLVIFISSDDFVL
jgi:hypothetical protein